MKKTWLQIAFGSFTIFILDQILKNCADRYLRIPFQLTDWFSLRYEQNFGIAWSIPLPHLLIITLNIAILITIPVYFSKLIDQKNPLAKLILALFIGGALGNTYDRLARGFVIDFISVGWFPVFNLADSALCIAIFLIFLFYGKIKRN